jgi:hypothetical protein
MNVQTLNKKAQTIKAQRLEVTRHKSEYWILHICPNNTPVPLYHSKKATEIDWFLDHLNR